MIQQPTINIEFEEDVDGVRFNWNRWPSSRIELEKVVLTLGCLYTPLKEPTDPRYNLQLQQAPITCCRMTCKAVLNPYCYPDLQSQLKGWICNFCNQRNQFPQRYQHIVDLQNIREFYRNTVDYVQSNQRLPHPPVFLFIIDSCVDEEEFTALKSSITSSLALLPSDALVGFITFSHIVYLWELENGQNLRSFVFSGSKDYKPRQLQDWLGLSLAPATVGMPMAARGPVGTEPLTQTKSSKFLKPVYHVGNILTNVLEQVGKNAWPTPPGRRPKRAVGAALSLAINILETTYPNSAARVMLFLGGPCTVGPGMVVDDDLKNTIRTHHDIDKDNASYLKKATEYYQTLATRASTNGHAIDIFSCALDQTGLHEMKCCTNMTNGLMVMGDSFDSNLFKTSFQRIFSKDENNNLKMAFNGILDVKTSRELKVSGAIGLCIGMNKKTPYVADKRDGIGGTSEWKFCSLIPSSTTAFYFVVQNSPAVTQAQQVPCGYVQFITQYNGSDGFKHIRVTTVRRYFGTDDYEFDQESAAVLLARMACYRSDTNEGTGQDILRWIDKSLVRVCQKFGEYHPNNSESFRLNDSFAMFPQFLFNLRRSQFIQVFNNSPDETSFYRHTLLREDCSNSLLMIQPALVAYELHKETVPVSLDTSSIQPDRILMMDTFFQIVIFHGDRIAAWKKQNYQEKPGYESFKLFLEAPINDANDLMMSRFPLPRYVVCDQGSSQARFLLSRVNPSITHNTSVGYYGDQSAAPVLSDDVSYAVFEEHLRRLTVSSSA
jgi:protein transport protein SEC23